MPTGQAKEGTWLEAIGLFQHAKAGDHLGGMRLLDTSADPKRVVHGLVRMLAIFLRGQDPRKIDQFLDASYRAGAPPLGDPFAHFSAATDGPLTPKLSHCQGCACEKSTS